MEIVIVARRYLENEGIHISSGRVLDTSYIHKFGAVPSMTRNRTGTIWDIDDTIYPWTQFDTPNNLVVLPVDEDDAGVGQSITLTGLDINGLPLDETLLLSSSQSVTTQNVFSRVFRAYFNDGATANAENIDVQLDGVTVLRINAGKGQTLMSVFTIPSNCNAYLTQLTGTIRKGADATFDTYIRYYGQNTFRIAHSAEISGEGGQYLYKFTTPIEIPAGSDIDLRASVRTNNARVTANFDLILVKK